MSRTIDELRADLHTRCARIDRTIKIMEVCGTHTVSIFRSGLRSLLPGNLRLISGPGCPVCVTAQRHIDAAIELATHEDLILTTYGDMMRVPGRLGSLERLRAEGADIRVVNSTRTAVEIARSNPGRPVVFLAVGFETTAPATAAAIVEAQKSELDNFSVLMCHKLVVPAMLALLQAGDVPLDGFLCPGHVSVIIGASAYTPVVEQHGKPCVVAGFEAGQIMQGLASLVAQIDEGRCQLENVYKAVVSDDGNPVARDLMDRVFVRADTPWRALGSIPLSGLELAPVFVRFDAARRFELSFGPDEDNPACRCGEVIQGKTEPAECALFDNGCTPLTPIGPCMVSTEGTCAAWYKYHRVRPSSAGSPTQNSTRGPE